MRCVCRRPRRNHKLAGSNAVAVSTVVDIGSASANDKSITLPPGATCPAVCGKDCYIADPTATGTENFQLFADTTNNKLIVHRTDADFGWAMDLKVPCSVDTSYSNSYINTGDSATNNKAVSIPPGTICPRSDSYPSYLDVGVDGTKRMNLHRNDTTVGWQATKLKCWVPTQSFNTPINIGSSTGIFKDVLVPPGTVCPYNCGTSCRLNKDQPTASLGLQMTTVKNTATSDKLQVRRTEGTKGWTMDLTVPCYVPAESTPGSIKVGTSATNDKVVSVPAGTICPAFCGKDCRLNTDQWTAAHTFKLTVNSTTNQLTVHRTDVDSGWDMDLIVPCYNATTAVSVGSSATNDKVVTVPAGTICPLTCGKDCRVNTDQQCAGDTFQLSVDKATNNLTVHRADRNSGWDMDLKVPCYVPPALA